MSKKYFLFLVLVLALAFSANMLAQPLLSPMEELGKALFFDTNLSTPPGQSCAACHAPEVGFTGPVSEINAGGAVYPGAVHTRFGNRKPPASSYGGDSPVFYYDEAEGLFIGGMFWDGRATGWTLGDPLAEQAQGPFLNPLEQNNPGAKQVCIKVAQSSYAGLYQEVFLKPVGFRTKAEVTETYENIARAIAAYERSAEVNPFSSKYDLYYEDFTPQELDGEALFNGKGQCNLCHVPPLFTDFTYDNLGIPKNPDNPFYNMPKKWNPDGENWIDPGLSGFLATTADYADKAAENYGKHKVPTLRNVDKRPDPGFVKAFGHNGYFKSLEDIVRFYNTRDVDPSWPDPEVPENVNTDELGNLDLTADEEAAIVAFMKTLSDGYTPSTAPVIIGGGAALAVIGPNPFNPSTRFSYTLPNPADIHIDVYNIVGQKVATLASGQQAAGEYQVEFNARDLASGIYLVRFQTGREVLTQKITLIK